MFTTVSSSAALYTALKAAKPGDTIALKGGDYGTLSLSNFNYAGTVTITSADPGRPAVIAGINLANSSGLTFSEIETFDDDLSANDSTGSYLHRRMVLGWPPPWWPSGESTDEAGRLPGQHLAALRMVEAVVPALPRGVHQAGAPIRSRLSMACRSAWSKPISPGCCSRSRWRTN